MDHIDKLFSAMVFGPIVLGVIINSAFQLSTPSGGVFIEVMRFVVNLISNLGYLGVFLLAFIEIIYPVIPGELVLPFVGFLVARGKMVFYYSILAATLGNVLGMLLIYLASMYLGRPFIMKYGKYFLLNERHLEVSERFFSKYGEVAVLVGRMIPGYRELISVPAGLGRMNIAKFTLLTFTGSLIWSFILIFMGVKLGENYILIREWFTRLEIFIWISVASAILWFIIKGWYRKSKYQQQTEITGT
ncbi:MAG: DedA family protein [Crenarchaeota archaeon]|nr:DedA family protein [Thermoproteota archaeon]MCR8455574.1 DedA family protein [Thermoproteota archaeon]